ncbi:MAG TPA: alpha/beta fold hydrolase [Pseudohaliea sp.]|nr:alpha/beta fold hydrolase [Pseudohaliea sp.]
MARLAPHLKAVALGARTLDALAPDLATRIMLRHFTRPRRKPGADYRQQLPAGARRLTLDHNGSELAAWCWGERGPSVLLVHGWEDHTGSMLPFVEPLRALGFRVFTLDAPGHGLSQRASTHLLDSSRALECMVLAHGPFDSIVAHSFGATAACLMLSRLPEVQPARMTLLAPMRDMEQHLQVFADIALLSPARADRLRRLVTRTIGMAPGRVCAAEALSGLAMPGLIIHDRHDPVIPHDAGMTLAESWRGATLISTSNLGHRRVLRCPRVLEEVLRLHTDG